MFLIWILFLIGLILIIKGGDYFVEAARWIAEVTGIPKFVIGATIVSMATTLPELLVSLIAVMENRVGMGIGNAVGSVTCNLGIIMAISVLAIPAVFPRMALLEKGGMMILAGAACLFLGKDGIITHFDAAILYIILALFIAQNTFAVRKSTLENRQSRPHVTKKTAVLQTGKFLFGAAAIVAGADLLVENGSRLARIVGVPESVIGLTLVAIGTSLPELVTTLTAIKKREAAMSIGNILGANIIDLCGILSTCALVSPLGLPVPRHTVSLDLPVCLLVMAVAIIPALVKGRFFRWQGAVMLFLYISYCRVLI